MTVRIVTDSGSDLPEQLVKSLNISIVPVYIYFGDKAYKDGIDISIDELYRRLVEDPIHPTTTQPLPMDFVNIYQELSKETNEIVSIHLSQKVSGTLNSALQAKNMVKKGARIEVVDSYSLSTGLGLIAMAAARVAQDGGTIEQVLGTANKIIKKIKLYGVLDTLKYLLAGGRITKTRALIGSLLNVKPVLTMSKGELIQYGMVRSFQKGIEKLAERIKKFENIEEIAIVHSTIPEKAAELKKMVNHIVPDDKIVMSRLGAGLGVHGGPGTLFVVIR